MNISTIYYYYMKTILVTGGTGLLGNSIKNILHHDEKYQKYYTDYRWIFANSKDCDLTNYSTTYNYLQVLKPYAIIHLAACVGGLYKNINDKRQMFEDNIKINMNVLSIAFDSDVHIVISCLSTCVFPDSVSYPIKEKDLHNGEPHESNYPYAYAKRFLEIQSRIYNQMETNKHFICVIPTNLYGPCDHFSLENGHVIPSLIHKFYLAKIANNENVYLRGNGKSLRQFLYVNDLSKIILSLLVLYNTDDCINKTNHTYLNNINDNAKKEKYNDTNKTYIVTPNEDTEISIFQVAKRIAYFIGYTGKILFDTSYTNGQYKKTASNDKLKKIFPDFIFTTIEEGLKETTQWFLTHYPNIRK